MGEWVNKKLSQITEIVGGYAFKGKHFGDAGVPVVKIKDINPPFINLKTVMRVDIDAHYASKNLDRYKIKKGDYLLAMTGATIGKLGVLTDDAIAYVNQRVALFRPKNGFSKQYVYYVMAQPNFQDFILNNVDSESAQANISAGSIGVFDFAIPTDEDEQKAIAGVLSSLDDKIDLLHRQNKTLEALAETLFRQWFIDEVEDDWETVRLEEYVIVHRGLSYKGAGLASEGNGIPMHNLNSVLEGGEYKYSGIKFYIGKYKDRHKISEGDIIVTNTEQGHDLLLIGYPARIPKYYGTTGIFSQHLYKLEIKELLSNEFLYFLLKSHGVRQQITGATIGN